MTLAVRRSKKASLNEGSYEMPAHGSSIARSESGRASPENMGEARNLQFDLSKVPRAWHGGHKSITTFFDNLSLFFPAGERFFIEAVRAHRDIISDAKLKDEAQLFCTQEGLHTREHLRYNQLLGEQGYPVKELEARVEQLLAGVHEETSPRERLAITCALEHFTAMMADWALADPALWEGADPNMAALWRWHAAEETEHKAVAFDVYQAAGGTYAERCMIMVAATVVFWAKVAEHQVRMMRADGTVWSADEWSGLLKYLFVAPGGLQKLFPAWLSFFSPRFHPWQHDNRSLLERWKQELATSLVYRGSRKRRSTKTAR